VENKIFNNHIKVIKSHQNYQNLKYLHKNNQYLQKKIKSFTQKSSILTKKSPINTKGHQYLHKSHKYLYKNQQYLHKTLRLCPITFEILAVVAFHIGFPEFVDSKHSLEVTNVSQKPAASFFRLEDYRSQFTAV